MIKCSKLAYLCAFIFLVAACGDDTQDNNGTVIVDPDTGPEEDVSTDVDAGPDAQADADAGPGDDADGGSDGGDGGTGGEGASCAEPTDLGTLSAGQEHQFDSTLLAPADALDSTCDLGNASTGVRVFSFQVEVDSRVGFWTNLSPSRLDLRDGSCDSPTEVITCTDGGAYTASLEAGKTYHLVVWGDFNVGDFQLRADVQEAVCSVNEPDWCDAGQMNQCVQGISVRSTSCADDCFDQTSCRADTCSSAIPIDVSSGSATYSGDTGAYTSAWTADQMPSCGFSNGAAGPDTPNAEAFFEVSGLANGDLLTVESTSSGDYAFFVLDGCSATECLAAVDSDENGDQRLEWRASQAGTYIVVIEALAGGDRSFDFQFSVQ